MFALNQLTGFRGSYVKTMSADGAHLEYQISKKNPNFVEVHSNTIHAMSALNCC